MTCDEIFLSVMGLIALFFIVKYIRSRNRGSEQITGRQASAYDPPNSNMARLQNYRIIRRLLDQNEIDYVTYEKLIVAFGIRVQDMGPLQSSGAPLTPPPLPYAQPRPAEPVYPAEAVAAPVSPENLRPTIPFQHPTPAPRPAIPVPQPHVTPPPPPTQMPSRPVPAPQPVKPVRPFSEILGAFMREANIRWGELVGGLLVVGCSVALVQTFWVNIAEQIWLKSAVFTAISTAIYAVGLYTEHRWKLPNTSRAVLLVASVLTPLTVLGILASKNAGATEGTSFIAASISLFLLGALLVPSSRVLASRFAWAFFVSILAGGVGLLSCAMMERAAGSVLHRPDAQLLLPLLLSLVGNLLAVYRQNKETDFNSSCADQLFIQLSGALGALIPVGIWIFALGSAISAPNAARQLAILMPLLALSFISVGGVVWKRIAGPDIANRKVAGTALTIIGGLLLLVAVVISYPLHQASILCGGYAAVLLAGAAWIKRKELTFGAMGFMAMGLAIWPNLNWAEHYPALLLSLGFVYGVLGVLGRLAILDSWRRPMAIGATALAMTVTGMRIVALVTSGGFYQSAPRWTLAMVCAIATGIVLIAFLALFVAEMGEVFLAFCGIAGATTALAFCPADRGLFDYVPAMAMGFSAIGLLVGVGKRTLPKVFGEREPFNKLQADRVMIQLAIGVLGVLSAIKFAHGLVSELAPVETIHFAKAPTVAMAGLLAMAGVGIYLHRLKTWLVFGGILVAMAVACANPLNSGASCCRWICALLLAGCCVDELVRKKSKPNGAYGVFSAVILVLTLIPAGFQLAGQPTAGPTEYSIFSKIGAGGNYLPPLLLIVATLSTVSAIKKNPYFAVAGGLILDLTIVLAYALHLDSKHLPLNLHAGIRKAQFVAMAASIYGAGWLACLRFKKPADPSPLLSLLGLSWLPLLGFMLVSQGAIWMNAATAWAPMAGLVGLVALGMTVALSYGICWIFRRSFPFAVHVGTILLACVVVGLRVDGGDHLHALELQLAGWVIGSFLIMLMGIIGARSFCGVDWSRKYEVAYSAVFLQVIAFVVGNVMHFNRLAPDRTWALIVYSSAVALLILLTVWTLNSSLLHIVGMLCLAGAWVWTVDTVNLRLQANIMGFALAGGGFLSILMDRLILPVVRGRQQDSTGVSWHNIACLLAIFVGVYCGLFWLFNGLIPSYYFYMQGAFVLLAIACLWDPRAFFALPSLYFIAFFGLLFAMDPLSQYFELRAWHFLSLAGGYHLLWCFGYNQRGVLVQFSGKIGVPYREKWTNPRNIFLRVMTLIWLPIVTVPGILIAQQHPDLDQRLASAGSMFLLAAALGLLGAEPGRPLLKKMALGMGVLLLTLWCLAIASFHEPAGSFNQMTLALVGFTLSTVILIVVPRWSAKASEEWTRCIESVSVFAGALAGITMLVILGSEVLLYPSQTPQMSFWAFSTILLALAGLCVGLFYLAFQKNKASWIYLGQMMIGVIFMHLRLTHPEWFGSGFFARNWPIIFLAIAYANAGVSEYLHRTGKASLARPFMNIGAFLPALVVVGFGAVSGQFADPALGLTPALLLAGAMYFGLALSRGNFILAMVGILATNGALWSSLWGSESMGFFKHPQLWISPLALSTLVAAHLNRNQLGAKAMASIRYACLAAIYASSSSDVWLKNDDLLMPLILAALAVLGVVLGIGLRIQSFLFMGASFVFVAMLALIRLASRQVNANWPWLIAGVILGIVIVVLFALFEKKRNEMLGMLDKLKGWEG